MAGRVFRNGRWYKVKKTLMGYRGGQEIWDTQYVWDPNQSDDPASQDRTGTYYSELGNQGTRTMSELEEAKRYGNGRPAATGGFAPGVGRPSPTAPLRDSGYINGIMLAQRKHVHSLVRRAMPAPENIHREGFQSAAQSYSEAAIDFQAGVRGLPQSNFVKEPVGGWHDAQRTTNPRVVQARNTTGVTRATVKSIAENLIARHAISLESQYRSEFTTLKREALSSGRGDVKERILAIQAQEANVISILSDAVKSGTTRSVLATEVSREMMVRPQSEWANIVTRNIRNLVTTTINPNALPSPAPYESQEEREHRKWRFAVKVQDILNQKNPVQYNMPIPGLTPTANKWTGPHVTGTTPSFKARPNINDPYNDYHPDSPRGTNINDYIGSGKFAPPQRTMLVEKSRSHDNPARALKEARDHWTQVLNRSTNDADRRKATEVLNAVADFEKSWNAKGNRGIAQINLPRAKQNKADAVAFAERDLQWMLDAEKISAGRSTWDQASHSHDNKVRQVFKETGLGTTLAGEDPTIIKQRQDAIDTLLRRNIVVETDSYGKQKTVPARNFFARQQSVFMERSKQQDYLGAQYNDQRKEILKNFLTTDPQGKQILSRFSSINEAVTSLRLAIGYRAQMAGFYNEPEARDIKGKGGKPGGFEKFVNQAPSGTEFINPENLTIKEAFGQINGPIRKELDKLGVRPEDRVHKLITQLSYVGRGRSGTLSTERGLADLVPNVINKVGALYGDGGMFDRGQDLNATEADSRWDPLNDYSTDADSLGSERDDDFAQMTSSFFGQTGALNRDEAEYSSKRTFSFNQARHRRMTLSEPRVKAAQFVKLWQVIAGVAKSPDTSPEFNNDVARYEHLAKLGELEILRGASTMMQSPIDQFLGVNTGAYDAFGGSKGPWGETGFFQSTAKFNRVKLDDGTVLDLNEDMRRFNEMEHGLGGALSREDAMTLFKSAGEHPATGKRRRDLPESPYGALHLAARGVTTALGTYNSLVRNTNERFGLSTGGEVPSYEASIEKAMKAGDMEAAQILENLSMQSTGMNPDDPMWMGRGLSSGKSSPFTHYLPFNPLFAAFRTDIESGQWNGGYEYHKDQLDRYAEGDTSQPKQFDPNNKFARRLQRFKKERGAVSAGLNPATRLLGSEGFGYMNTVLRETLNDAESQYMDSGEFNSLFLQKLGAKRNERGHIELKDGTVIEKGTKLTQDHLEDLFHKAFSGELQDWGTNAGYKMVDEFDETGSHRPIQFDRGEMSTKALAKKLVLGGTVKRALGGTLSVPYTQGPGDSLFGETYMSDYHPGDKLLRPIEKATQDLFQTGQRKRGGMDTLVNWSFLGVRKNDMGKHLGTSSENAELYGKEILNIRESLGLWGQEDEDNLVSAPMNQKPYNFKRKAEEMQYRLLKFGETMHGARNWFAKAQGSDIRNATDNALPSLLIEAGLLGEDKWQVLAAQKEHRMGEYSHASISEVAPRLASYFAGNDAPMQEAIMHSTGIHGPPNPKMSKAGVNHLEFAAIMNAAFETVAGQRVVNKQKKLNGKLLYKPDGTPDWETHTRGDLKGQPKRYLMSEIDESMDEFRSRSAQEISHAMSHPNQDSLSGITMTRSMILGESTKTARDFKNATRGVGLYSLETAEDVAKFQDIYTDLLADYRKSSGTKSAVGFNGETLKKLSDLLGWNYDSSIWEGGLKPSGESAGFNINSPDMPRNYLGDDYTTLIDRLEIDSMTGVAIAGHSTHAHIGDIGNKFSLVPAARVNKRNVGAWGREQLAGMYSKYYDPDSPDSAIGRLLRAEGTLSDGRTVNLADTKFGAGGNIAKLVKAQGSREDSTEEMSEGKSIFNRIRKSRYAKAQSGHAMSGLASIGGLGLTIGATAIAAKLGFDPLGLGDAWNFMREGWGTLHNVIGGGTVSALMGASAKWRNNKGQFMKAPETMLDLYGDEQGVYTNPIRINAGNISDSPNYEDRMFGYIEQLKNKSKVRQLQFGPKGLRDEHGRFRQLTLDDFASGGSYTNLLTNDYKDNFVKDLLNQGGPLALGSGRLPRPALVTPDVIALGAGSRSMRKVASVNRVKRTPAQPLIAPMSIVSSVGRGSQGTPPPPGSSRNFSDPYEFHRDPDETISPTDLMMQGLVQFAHKNKEPLFDTRENSYKMMTESDYARAHEIGKAFGYTWTDAQAQAIGMPSIRGAAPSVITGNPGSGKTDVEIARVLMRLGDPGMAPENAPVLTSFANATMNVTKDRLASMIAKGGIDPETYDRYINASGVTTIHSLGLDLMGENRLKMTNVFGSSGQIGKDTLGGAIYGQGGTDIRVHDDNGRLMKVEDLAKTQFGSKYLENINGEWSIKKGAEFTKFVQAEKSHQIETFREATHEFWNDQMAASGWDADNTDVMRYASGSMPFEYSSQGMKVRRGIRDGIADRDRPFVALKAEMKNSAEERLWKNVQILAETGIKPHTLIDFFNPSNSNMSSIDGFDKFKNKQGEMWLASQIYQKIDEIQQRGSLGTFTDKEGNQTAELIRHYMPWDMVNKPLQYIQDHMKTDLSTGKEVMEPEIANALRDFIDREYIVSEAQDANLGQLSLLKVLSGGRLTLSGDPKQDLYPWRGGSRRWIKLAAEAAKKHGSYVHLADTHRFTGGTADFLNELYSKIKFNDSSGGLSRLIPEAPLKAIGKKAHIRNSTVAVSIDPYGMGGEYGGADWEHEVMAQQVRHMTGLGVTTDGLNTHQTRAIQGAVDQAGANPDMADPGDFMVVTRSNDDVAKIVKKYQDRGIKVMARFAEEKLDEWKELSRLAQGFDTDKLKDVLDKGTFAQFAQEPGVNEIIETMRGGGTAIGRYADADGRHGGLANILTDIIQAREYLSLPHNGMDPSVTDDKKVDQDDYVLVGTTHGMKGGERKFVQVPNVLERMFKLKSASNPVEAHENFVEIHTALTRGAQAFLYGREPSYNESRQHKGALNAMSAIFTASQEFRENGSINDIIVGGEKKRERVSNNEYAQGVATRPKKPTRYGVFGTGGYASHEEYDKIVVGDMGPEIVINKEGKARKFKEPAVLDVKEHGGILRVLNADDTRKAELAGLYGHTIASAAGGIGKGYGSLTPFSDTSYGEAAAKELTNFLKEVVKVEANLISDGAKGHVVQTNAASDQEANLIKTAILSWSGQESTNVKGYTNANLIARGRAVDPTHSAFTDLQTGGFAQGAGNPSIGYGRTLVQLEKMAEPLEKASERIGKLNDHLGPAAEAVKRFADKFGTDSQGLIKKNQGTSSHRVMSLALDDAGQPMSTHEEVMKSITGVSHQTDPIYDQSGNPMMYRHGVGYEPLPEGRKAPMGFKDFINGGGGGGSHGRGYDTGGLGDGMLGKMHGVAANMNTFAWAFQPIAQNMQERGQRAMQAQQDALAFSENREATILMTGGATRGLGMGQYEDQRTAIRGVYDSLYSADRVGSWTGLTTPNITSAAHSMAGQGLNVLKAIGGLIEEGYSQISGQGSTDVSRRNMSRYDYWQNLGIDKNTYNTNMGLAATAMGVQVNPEAIAAYADSKDLFDNLTKALVKAEETYGKSSEQYLAATQNLVTAYKDNPLAGQGYGQVQDLMAAGDVGNKLAKWGSLYGMDATTSMSPIRIAQMAGYSTEDLKPSAGGDEKVMAVADILNKAANMAGIDPAAMMGVFKYSGSASLPTLYAGQGSYLAETRGLTGTPEERKAAFIASQSVNALRKGQEPEQVGRAYRTVNAMINDPQGKQSYLMARSMGIMNDDFTLTGSYREGTFNKDTGEYSGQLRTGDPAVLKRVIEEVQSAQEIKTSGIAIRQQQLSLYGNAQTKGEFQITAEKLNIQAQSVALESKMLEAAAPFQKAQMAGSIALNAMQSSEAIRSAGFNASSRIQGMEDSVFYGQQSQQRNELAREQRSIAATRAYEDMLYGAPGQDRSYRSYYSAQANAAAQGQSAQNVGQYNQTVVNAVGLEAAQTYRGLDYQRQMVTLGQSQLNSGAAYAAQMKYIEDQKQFADIKFEGDSKLRGTQRDIQDQGLQEQIDLLPVIQELEKARHEEGQRQARAALDIAIQQGVVTDAANASAQIELDNYDAKLKLQLDSNKASEDEIKYQRESLDLQKENAELQLENSKVMLEYSKELKDTLAYNDLGGGIGGNRTDINGVDSGTGWVDLAAGNDMVAKFVQDRYDFYLNKAQTEHKDWSESDQAAYAKAQSGQVLTGAADIDNVAAGVLVEGATLTKDDIKKQWTEMMDKSRGSIEGTLATITTDAAAGIINTANTAGINADINAGLNTPEAVQSFAASVGIFEKSIDKLATQTGVNSVMGAGSGILSGLLGGVNLVMTARMLTKLGAGGAAGAGAAGAAGTGAATAAAGGGEAAVAATSGSALAGAAFLGAAFLGGALLGNEIMRFFNNRKGTKEGRFITSGGGDLYDENGNLAPDVAQYMKDNPIVETNVPVYGPEVPKGFGTGPWSGSKRDFTYFTGTDEQAEVLNVKSLPKVGTGDAQKDVDGWWGNVKEDVGNFFGSIGDSITGTFDMVKGKGDDIFNGAFNFFYNIDEKLTTAKNWVSDNGGSILDGVSDMIKSIRSITSNATNWVSDNSGAVFNQIFDLFFQVQYAFGYAKDWVSNSAGSAVSWMAGLFDAVKQWVRSMVEKIPGVGGKLADQMFGDGHAAGGYTRGGLIRVGEQGPEMILSQRGDYIMPAAQTMQMMRDWSPSNDMRVGHERSLHDESVSLGRNGYNQRVFGLDPVTARNISETGRGGNSIEINITVESGANIDPMMIDKLKAELAREVRKAIED